MKTSNPEQLLAILKEREINQIPFSLLPFYGHNPSADGSLTPAIFSQWWQGHPFTVDGITYLTCEHYMMAQKASLFEDKSILQKVLDCPTPKEAKALGRRVQNFDENTWNAKRYKIVCSGNLAKFEQHKDLGNFLRSTQGKVLVEASPYDTIWGVGLGMQDSRLLRPSAWRGLNLLGFALCDVRQVLLQEVQLT